MAQPLWRSLKRLPVKQALARSWLQVRQRRPKSWVRGSEYLQTVSGVELPMHDPRYSPRFARTYQCDPTPARHVKGGLGIPDFRSPNEVKYDYEQRGEMDVAFTCRAEIVNASGACQFGGFSMPPDALPGLIEAATGWDFKAEEMMRTGKRIMNMRHAFNLREGLKHHDSRLPGGALANRR